MIFDKYVPILLAIIPSMFLTMFYVNYYIWKKKTALTNIYLLPFVLFILKNTMAYYVPATAAIVLTAVSYLLLATVYGKKEKEGASFYFAIILPFLLTYFYDQMQLAYLFDSTIAKIVIGSIIIMLSIRNARRDTLATYLGIASVISLLPAFKLQALLSLLMLLAGTLMKLWKDQLIQE